MTITVTILIIRRPLGVRAWKTNCCVVKASGSHGPPVVTILVSRRGAGRVVRSPPWCKAVAFFPFFRHLCCAFLHFVWIWCCFCSSFVLFFPFSFFLALFWLRLCFRLRFLLSFCTFSCFVHFISCFVEQLCFVFCVSGCGVLDYLLLLWSASQA